MESDRRIVSLQRLAAGESSEARRMYAGWLEYGYSSIEGLVYPVLINKARDAYELARILHERRA